MGLMVESAVSAGIVGMLLVHGIMSWAERMDKVS